MVFGIFALHPHLPNCLSLVKSTHGWQSEIYDASCELSPLSPLFYSVLSLSIRKCTEVAQWVMYIADQSACQQ